MTTQAKVCVCGTCVGTQCTCGCQNPVPVQAASCQCGEACNCGETCTCSSCQHANARISGQNGDAVQEPTPCHP
jgi:hypothetical protein